jgi:hypothetical protein
MPAAIPHKMRWVQGRDVRRSKNTPAAPSAVHAAGNSSAHAVKRIRFKTAFPLFPVYAARRQKVRRQQKSLQVSPQALLPQQL